MASRLAALLPRMVALTLVWLLATSTITFAAAGQKLESKQPAPTPAPKRAEKLVVPDVRRQAYVFAKGILDDAGFAWRVKGPVQGYAPNIVAAQTPAPGAEVVDTGLPTIVLRLERNKDYAERGLPENASPRKGNELVLAADAAAPKAAEKPAAKNEAPANEPDRDEPAPDAQGSGVDDAADDRKPDFEVPGAPKEPLDEMPLPQRAKLLERRVAAQPKPTRALVRYWLYQHAWIVTGARFGWSDGAEALEILIRVDRDLERRWGVGERSEAVARAALAEVRSKAGK